MTTESHPEYHVLHFCHDNDDASALTALIRGARYHIIADPSKLADRSTDGKKIAGEYRQLLAQIKTSEAKEAEEEVEGEQDASADESAKDSGVDVTPDRTETATDAQRKSHQLNDQGSCLAIEKWMLEPLFRALPKEDNKDDDDDDSPSTKTAGLKGKSVQEWYHCPTHFYDLVSEDGVLVAKQDEDPSDSLTNRTQKLIPSMPLPKCIRQLDIPAISAGDLTVLHESDEIPPIHPAIVRYKDDGREYFLKVIDINQHQPCKREIHMMKKIESKGLHKEFKVPLLRGLVHFTKTTTKSSSSSSEKESRSPEIMGFIMDAIPDPTPLTHKLDSSIPQAKRDAWSNEVQRIVDILHANDLVWGDAKGDNFMVDKNDELWIIDFGGSYTPGWVDPELKETEEGDDMGVERVVNGLDEPEENTTGGTKNATETNNEAGSHAHKEDGKRERTEESQRPNKRRRMAEGEDEATAVARYCYCDGVDSGKMLACDGQGCSKEWFHFECVGIDSAPPKGEKWFCKDCRAV